MLSGMKQQRKHMSHITRREYLRVLRPKYLTAKRQAKSLLLDDTVTATGLHRKAVIRIWRSNPIRRQPSAKRGRAVYSLKTKQAVIALWHTASNICAERLQPFIPDLLDKLVACGELVVSDETDVQLRKISLATVKRIVGTEKRRSTLRIGGSTKPGRPAQAAD